eukprot:CAMPEP_0167768238 /NCGR_PEP_ID=MMETSP0110_2-20121227/16524_1 /TAXON_ID=629695 /ORGANISM="Gymnochlora sp., Strain CCMP2014" /LENGTH=236 /DNA_ID=CAMNT_0007656825 /DNA_START=62 /DNA_END=770 /DNA_ORIENTATION=-
MILDLPGNDVCADCPCKYPDWSSINLGIMISGLHRGLGTHISKVRSIEMDVWPEKQLVYFYRLGGNKAVNRRWEARLDNFDKPGEGDVRAIREFIKEKYVQRRYYSKDGSGNGGQKSESEDEDDKSDDSDESHERQRQRREKKKRERREKKEKKNDKDIDDVNPATTKVEEQIIPMITAVAEQDVTPKKVDSSINELMTFLESGPNLNGDGNEEAEEDMLKRFDVGGVSEDPSEIN